MRVRPLYAVAYDGRTWYDCGASKRTDVRRKETRVPIYQGDLEYDDRDGDLIATDKLHAQLEERVIDINGEPRHTVPGWTIDAFADQSWGREASPELIDALVHFRIIDRDDARLSGPSRHGTSRRRGW